jgi:hypothetical protein
VCWSRLLLSLYNPHVIRLSVSGEAGSLSPVRCFRWVTHGAGVAEAGMAGTIDFQDGDGLTLMDNSLVWVSSEEELSPVQAKSTAIIKCVLVTSVALTVQPTCNQIQSCK